MKQKTCKISLLFLACVVFFTTTSVSAQNTKTQELVEQAYRQFFDVPLQTILVPTVLEIPIPVTEYERSDFAIFNTSNNSFEPYYFKQLKNNTPVTADVDRIGDAHLMTDGKVETFTQFDLEGNQLATVLITLTASKPITASSLSMLLDNNVALPVSVSLEATTQGTTKVIVAEKALRDTTVTFPKTTASVWKLHLRHIQPLRISEIRFAQENTTVEQSTLRFLAQPQNSYRIYFDPDRSVSIPTAESGTLSSAENILSIALSRLQKNIKYKPSDTDSDSIPDAHDNCVGIANKDQTDTDNNKRGDACDDFDLDGIINSKDNCQNKPNRDQLDTDSDKIGDVCDEIESRVTERLTWLPWAGIGFASIVVILLFASLARKKKPEAPSTKLWNERIEKNKNKIER